MWLMAMLPTWIFLPDDYVSDEEIPRKSQDNIVNSNGQLLLEFLKHSDLRIANGRVCEDKQIGAYTYVCSKGSSLVDYCIVNIELLSDFSSFYVHDPNMLSDLCLNEFAFSSSFVLLDENMYSENDGAHFHYYKWDTNSKEEYQSSISSSVFKEEISSLTESVKMHLVMMI